VIVAPNGTIVAGPLNKKHGILYAECDPGQAASAHRTLDVAGHYSRPDVFRLEVRREAAVPITFRDHPQLPGASASPPDDEAAPMPAPEKTGRAG
jgi:hypothetical protein